MIKKITTIIFTIIILGTLFSGCTNNNGQSSSNDSDSNSQSNIANNNTSNDSQGKQEIRDLEVRFGQNGEAFTIKLYENDTAAEIARSVGTADWNLPIYNFDNYDNWEVMQYYDIPSRYNIPSNAEVVTSQKAGEVYYSEPNRIILFYQDAQVEGEYTKVGYLESIDGLLEAVQNNPQVQGWSNKIVSITSIR